MDRPSGRSFLLLKNRHKINVAICVICAIVANMADLRVQNIDPKVMAQLKSKAALAGKTLRDFVEELLRKVAK